MDILVLKKNDSMKEMLSKLDEEIFEVIHAATSQTNEETAGEVLDTIQVCIGILDKLSKDGVDIEAAVEGHNRKLLGRGWDYTKVIRINVEGGEVHGNP